MESGSTSPAYLYYRTNTVVSQVFYKIFPENFESDSQYYKDFIEKSNILFNTPEGKNIYHVGDFNYRLIALMRLFV